MHIELVECFGASIHLFFNGVVFLFLFGVKVRTFIAIYFFDERLVDWSLALRLLGCTDEISLNSLDVLVGRLLLA